MNYTIAIKVLVTCLLAVFPKSANAAWDAVTTGKVGDIYVGGTGHVYFNLVFSPPLCASAGSDKTIGLLYVPPQTDSLTNRTGSKALLAVLTSAKQSGQSVTVYANNGTTWGCLVGGVQPGSLLPIPTVDLKADPYRVNPGGFSQSTTLTWSSTNATACALDRNTETPPPAVVVSRFYLPASGSQVESHIYYDTTFSMVCAGPGGTSQVKSITVFAGTTKTSY